MVSWQVEVTRTKDKEFPWKSAVVGENGRRQEVGEFAQEKEARSYAAMEWNRLTAKEKPEAVGAS